MKKFILFVVFSLFLPSLVFSAGEVWNMSATDPDTRGVWRVLMISNNYGEDIESVNEIMFIVYSDKVHMTSGETVQIKAIKGVIDTDGTVYNAIYFKSAPSYWVISKGSDGLIFVKVVDSNSNEEKYRFLVKQE